jgi:hypothetical protein
LVRPTIVFGLFTIHVSRVERFGTKTILALEGKQFLFQSMDIGQQLAEVSYRTSDPVIHHGGLVDVNDLGFQFRIKPLNIQIHRVL